MPEKMPIGARVNQMRQIEIHNNGGHHYTIAYPLCGWDWLEAHLNDHTYAEVEALTIEIGYNSRWLPPVSAGDKRGTANNIVKELR